MLRCKVPKAEIRRRDRSRSHSFVYPFLKATGDCFLKKEVFSSQKLKNNQGRRFGRCVQPIQQQGLRMPPLSFESAFLIRIFLVSTFLPDVTQQIHSLRASGVISSHTAFAAGVTISALRK